MRKTTILSGRSRLQAMHSAKCAKTQMQSTSTDRCVGSHTLQMLSIPSGGNEAEPADLRPQLQKFKQRLRARGRGAVETCLLNLALLSRFDAPYKLMELTAA